MVKHLTKTIIYIHLKGRSILALTPVVTLLAKLRKLIWGAFIFPISTLNLLKTDKSSLGSSWMLRIRVAKREIKWLTKIHRIMLQPTHISFCYRIRTSTRDNRVINLVILHSTNKRTSLIFSSLWIKDAVKGRGLIRCTDCFQVSPTQHLWQAQICSPQTKTPCSWSIQVSTQ